MYCHGVPTRVTSFIRVYPSYLLYTVDNFIYKITTDGETSLSYTWGKTHEGRDVEFRCFSNYYGDQAFRWKAPIKRYEEEEWRFFSRPHNKKEITMYGFRHPVIEFKELL